MVATADIGSTAADPLPSVLAQLGGGCPEGEGFAKLRSRLSFSRDRKEWHQPHLIRKAGLALNAGVGYATSAPSHALDIRSVQMKLAL